jgi:hypothetical protein
LAGEDRCLKLDYKALQGRTSFDEKGKDRRPKGTSMKRRRPLITPPLYWQMSTTPVPHPVIPVLAERGGTQLKTPRPVVLVDTREQNPFDFSRFEGWFAGIEKRPLKLGDYSIAGLEDICVAERKDLSDLIRSLTAERTMFIIASGSWPSVPIDGSSSRIP